MNDSNCYSTSALCIYLLWVLTPVATNGLMGYYNHKYNVNVGHWGVWRTGISTLLTAIMFIHKMYLHEDLLNESVQAQATISLPRNFLAKLH